MSTASFRRSVCRIFHLTPLGQVGRRHRAVPSATLDGASLFTCRLMLAAVAAGLQLRQRTHSSCPYLPGRGASSSSLRRAGGSMRAFQPRMSRGIMSTRSSRRLSSGAGSAVEQLAGSRPQRRHLGSIHQRAPRRSRLTTMVPPQRWHLAGASDSASAVLSACRMVVPLSSTPGKRKTPPSRRGCRAGHVSPGRYDARGQRYRMVDVLLSRVLQIFYHYGSTGRRVTPTGLALPCWIAPEDL